MSLYDDDRSAAIGKDPSAFPRKPVSKKNKIARLILSMSSDELMTMAGDFVSMQSNAEDDLLGFNLESHPSVKRMLRNWANGLGSMP